MSAKPYPLRTLVTLALLLPVAAQAFNTLFLRDSPMSKMTDEEFATMEQVVYDTLENGADGQPVEWGETDGAHGKVSPGPRFEQNGLTCRKAAYHNYAGGQEAKGGMTFCKDADGAWKLVP